MDPSLRAVLADHARHPESAWVCGRFGALAEFTYESGEPIVFIDGGPIGAVTARGGFHLAPAAGLRAVAYETVAKAANRWGQGLVLCLPLHRARLGERTVVTELGPDREALRPQDRGAILFDLGIGKPQSEICVRSTDAETVARLRAICGHPLFSHEAASLLADMPALSPHRVFRSTVARVEVYQPIPPPDGKTPDGPHTHVVRERVSHRRSHAATVPIPAGWLPVLWLFPPHPLQDGFDRGRYEMFQDLLRRYGEPATLQGKAAFARGDSEDSLPSRAARLAYRVARRQAAHLTCDGDPARRAGRRPAG
jgi:hypothetical protein